jgi:hypothetical protein
MKELKQEIDDLEHKKVITAYFDNSEDKHDFLYLRIETVANFAGLQFKEDGGAFFYAPTNTKEDWKPVTTLESLETLILDRIMYKGTYFTCKDKALEYFDAELDFLGLEKEKYDEIMIELNKLDFPWFD